MTTQRIAELEAEVLRLRGALRSCYSDWEGDKQVQHFNIGLVFEALSIPFTPTALPELIEKVEKMTIERCAGVCKTLDRKEKRHATGYGPGYLTYTASDCEQIIRALPTGHIKLEELL